MSNFRLFDLNPEQHAAVTTAEGPMLILAGAGTGKTRVITFRIACLIENGIPAERIYAVTFTNKAAREMKSRIESLVGPEQAAAVNTSTFHALCVRILRAHATLLGYKPNFSIFDDGDQLGLVKKIITKTAAKDERLEPGLALSLISKAKNQSWSAPENDDTLIGAVFRRYQEALKLQNAVDFDDLLVLAVRLLAEHREVRDIWRSRIEHLLVDEFQDTNQLQLELVTHLIGGTRPNICVVGDDDQSIYGWRGADISNILEFERHFPDPSIFRLEQNYRSTNAILGAANRLIVNNKARRGKRLWSAGEAGAPVQIIALPKEREEAEFVVSEIAALRETEGLSWNEFAVIFRMNAQSRLLEEELRRYRIPYRVVGGKSFFDRREIKDFLAYLAATVNPSDDQALLRIINTPPRGIGATTVELLIDASAESGRPIQEVMASPEFLSRFSKKAASALTEFLQALQTLRIRCATPGADLAGMTRQFLDQCEYFSDLNRSCKTPEETLNRETNVKEMLTALENHQKSGKGGLEGFLDTMNLDREREEDKADDPNGVTLITMHAAKGLEFSHVHLVGAEDGLLPHSRSLEEGTLDEERRLFYVGITRARKTLVITHCLERSRYGSSMLCAPSRFLEEIEGEGVVRQNYQDLMEQEPEEDYALAQFSRMRELMSGD